ncbi:MAG: hypothetical protein V4617_10785 [Gemmatimonadota bacterium]
MTSPRIPTPTRSDDAKFGKFTPHPMPDGPIPSADDGVATPRPRAFTRRKLNDEEAKELDSAKTSPDAMDTLTPDERNFAKEAAPIVQAALVKSILARAEPGKYRMADDDDDIEQIMSRGIARLDTRLVEKLAGRAEMALRDEKRAARLLGSKKIVLLREPAKTKKIVHRVAPNGGSQGNGDTDRPRVVVRPRDDKEEKERPVYTRVLAELRAIHAVRITEPRDNPDEMILGTVLVGAGGNVTAGYGGDMGEFMNGDRYSFGELPIGQFSLKSTKGYPKHMYVLFKLVEVDSDGKEAAAELTRAIGGIASLIASALATPAVGAAVGTMITAIGGIFENLIDDDEMRIVGKRLTLDDMYDLGGSVGPAERTDDITGHGGKYRIGYRWLMGA